MSRPLAGFMRRAAFSILWAAAISSGVARLTSVSVAQDQPQAIQAEVELVLDAAADSGYWIGVACHPLENEAREKLKLAPGQGLVIDEVLPDSPAAKAGLKGDDILLAVGDKPLSSGEELVRIVGQTKDGALKLHIVRGGEKQAIEVRPAKRPTAGLIFGFAENEKDGNKEAAEKELRTAQERLEQLRKVLQDKAREPASKPAPPAPSSPIPTPPSPAIPGLPPMPGMAMPRMPGSNPAAPSMRMAAPSMPGAPGMMSTPGMMGGSGMMSAAMQEGGPLPADMKVTIEKQGRQPATITVKQGKKLWKTTEQELDMLPSAARAYVARVLGQPAMMGMSGSMMMPGMSPGGAVPRGQPLHFELKLDEKGQVRSAEMLPGKKRPGQSEAGQREAGQPSVKVLPGGGVQIEIREADEKKPEKSPSENPVEDKQAGDKKPAGEPAIRWLELKRPEAGPPKRNAEQELRDLQEQVKLLRQKLDELRKAAGEK